MNDLKLHPGRKRAERRLKEKLRKAYGQIPEREYEPGAMVSIASFYRKYMKDSWSLDDITWNDLDMDRIFMVMNQTSSSSGEEYLYYMLRTPCADPGILNERERLITFFSEHEEERLKLSVAFAHIGKTKGLSVTEYMDRLLELEERSNTVHIVQAILGALSIAALVVAPTVGILIFLAVMCVNIGTYYKQMGKDRPYISCFRYVMRLLAQAEELEKTSIPEISGYLERMHRARISFERFRRNSFLLKEGQNLAGDLMESVMDYFRMFFHLDIIKFNSMLEELKKHAEDARILMEQAGILEACIAAASFRELMPYYAQPRFCRKRILHVSGMYHPLIEEPVPNDISAEGGVLITGSNASGKSTFLKTAAVNAILAQTIHTALARSYEGAFFRIYTSMALKDDLLGRESYYLAEIRSLKRILDEIGEEYPVLCFVDEVLRGTNTVERIAASAQILGSLSGRNVICFAATHDIELTYILEDDYENYHFTEEVSDDRISFSYRLLPGRSTTRNAIRLLKLIGYEEEIVEKAEASAEAFLEEGVWKRLKQKETGKSEE